MTLKDAEYASFSKIFKIFEKESENYYVLTLNRWMVDVPMKCIVNISKSFE